jgi:hypothetical protein
MMTRIESDTTFGLRGPATQGASSKRQGTHKWASIACRTRSLCLPPIKTTRGR